jgi:hypothetical protein
MAISSFILAFLLIAIVGVLVGGIVLMGMGGKTNAKYGNTLMVARIALQGLVLLVLAMVFATGKS